MKPQNPPRNPQSNREQHYRSPAFEPPRGGEGFDAGQRHWRDGHDDWHGERAGGNEAPSGQHGFQPESSSYGSARAGDHAAATENWQGHRGGSYRDDEPAGRWQSDYGPYAGREPYPPRDRGNRHPGIVGNWQEPLGTRGAEGGFGYGARDREGPWSRGMQPRAGEFARADDEGYAPESWHRGHGGGYAQRPYDDFRGAPGGARESEYRGASGMQHRGGYGSDHDGGTGGGYGRGYGGVSRDMAAWDRGPAQRGPAGQLRSQRGPKGYTRSDERIREDVCERLMQQFDIDVGDVSVDVESGTVKLSGEVQERWMKHRIEDIADGCGGVKDVRNHIEVARQRTGDLSGAAAPSRTSEGAAKGSQDGGKNGQSSTDVLSGVVDGKR